MKKELERLANQAKLLMLEENTVIRIDDLKVVVKKCLSCKKTFVVNYGTANNGNNRGIFCSRECHYSMMNKKIKIKCNSCGDFFTIRPSIAKRKHLHHCSLECKYKYLSNKFSGIGNPVWSGGSREFFQYAANAIYREHHVNIICSYCGSPEDICIHHIDGDWKNNAIKNLIPACRSCHSKLHNLKGGYYAKRIKSVR
jgi:hypothetical protein